MPRHRFDALSFALGLLAVVGAVAVMADLLLEAEDPAGGGWLAVAALVLGLGLIPWSQARRAGAGDGAAGTAGATDDVAIDPDDQPVDVTSHPTAGSA